MLVPEQTLTLDLLPLSADTARLVRVYGTEPCVVLPGTLPAPEGGSFAVTELGDYCFSEKPRSLPGADKTCRYEITPDGMIFSYKGYRFKRINEAEGDAAAFTAVLGEFVKAPEVTRTRIYLETLGDVLPQAKQGIIVDESVQQILPMLPLPQSLPGVAK